MAGVGVEFEGHSPLFFYPASPFSAFLPVP